MDGKRMEFSSKEFIDAAKWSTELSKMKGTSEEASSLNKYLNLMKSKIFNIQMELIHKNELLTLEVFKNKLQGIEERQRPLIPILQDHNNKIKELVPIEYTLLVNKT
jgi:hypothetical protein